MAKFVKTQDQIRGDLERRVRQLNTVAPQAYKFFHDITPVQSGNARSKTRLDRDTIRADYPYAGRLDSGWSRQFGGRGMSRPTIQFVQRLVKKILGL